MKEPLLWWELLDAETTHAMPMWVFYLIHWFAALPIQCVLWVCLPNHHTKDWW